jgi:phage baseplate assembly protein V
MYQQINKQIQQAINTIRKPFRAVLKRVNSSEAIQTVQAEGLAGEQLQDNELMQHYGFTSRPLPGSTAVVIPLGGQTSHGVIIATEHGKYRLTELESGEVAIYTDEETKIVLKRGRLIEVDCDVFKINCQSFEVNATSNADFNTPMLTASQQATVKALLSGTGGLAISGGAANVAGTVNAKEVTASGVSLKSHTHTGNEGRPTSTPN